MKHHSVVGGVAAILTMLVRSRLKWCVDLSTYGFEGFEAKIQGCSGFIYKEILLLYQNITEAPGINSQDLAL